MTRKTQQLNPTQHSAEASQLPTALVHLVRVLARQAARECVHAPDTAPASTDPTRKTGA